MAIDYHSSLSRFQSDLLKATIYHELSHASQYTKLGTTWYSQFVNAILAEILAHPSGALNPYGDGHSSNSPIIALGEAWGYHMEHFLADQRYGVTTSEVDEAWGVFQPSLTMPTHTYINAIENFVPSLTADPFHWIPKGVMEDLMDDGAEPPPTHVIDQVSGLTIAQIFAAFQSDITTIPQYKARLLQQIGASPTLTANINNLFTSYNF